VKARVSHASHRVHGKLRPRLVKTSQKN
jgi:hypothetical protein